MAKIEELKEEFEKSFSTKRYVKPAVLADWLIESVESIDRLEQGEEERKKQAKELTELVIRKATTGSKENFALNMIALLPK